ncbi:GNAT family N-acetyltransferase [Leifsonia sp. YAF41]|uniref:GNAT family N-acetyltransferase n=1 Tax=Leifsonia sp. YAF41 TaxID=3233086 RepID=UPI003F96196C
MSGIVALTVLDREILLELAEGDLAAAGERAGVVFPEFFRGESWLWTLHVARMHDYPASVGWLSRVVTLKETDEVIGHAGFHFNPDASGMVEIGYTIVPEHRGCGLARETAGELLAFAAAQPSVRIVRASVSPENAASLSIVQGWGFVHVGEEWDPEDGLELVFERQADAPLSFSSATGLSPMNFR